MADGNPTFGHIFGHDFAHEPLLDRPVIGRVFESTRRVRLADSSPNGRLRLDAGARYLQDIANDDSRDAGSPNPTAWVARRTVIRVEHFPEYLDMMELATWCSGLGSRWAERRYSMVGADESAGRIQAATLWVHIDMATMRPVKVPDGFAEQFGAAAQGRTISARQHLPNRPPEVGPAVGGDNAIESWPLRFVDFDVLGHVNNSVYWAIVEEHLARRRDLRAPFTVTLEHHDAIEHDSDVSVVVVDTEVGLDLWIRSADRIAAVVRATRAG